MSEGALRMTPTIPETVPGAGLIQRNMSFAVAEAGVVIGMPIMMGETGRPGANKIGERSPSEKATGIATSVRM